MFHKNKFGAGPQTVAFKGPKLPVAVQEIPGKKQRRKHHRNLFTEQSQDEKSDASKKGGPPFSLPEIRKTQHSSQKEAGCQQILASRNISYRRRLYRMACK